MLVDTHAHLTYPQLADERADVIERAVGAGVTRIIDVGTNAETSRQAVTAVGNAHRMYASAGVHPHDSESVAPSDLDTIEGMLREQGVVAVGETGLDFFRDYAPHDLQESLFRRHVEMALASSLPLIIHSRGAEDRVIEVLEEMEASRVGGVLHCFGGTAEQADRAVRSGFHLGYGGTVTFKNSDTLDVALSIPEERLLLETDCPYLAPVPHRGKRNEPAYVHDIAAFLADAKGTSLDRLAEQTTANAVSLFRLED